MGGGHQERDEIEDWHAFYYHNYYRLLLEDSVGQPRVRMSDALEVGDVLEKRKKVKENKRTWRDEGRNASR